MAYDITFLDTSNSFLDLIVGINDQSGKVLFATILLTIFIIVFIATKRYDTNTAFINASATSTLFGAMMMFAGLITWTIAIIPVIMLLISILINVFGEGS